MEIKTNQEDGRLYIALSGRIDSNTTPELEKHIAGITEDVEELVLDLDGTTYISSAGLRLFLNARRIMKNQGAMKVIHISDDIMDIFDMTGFTGLLNL